LNAAYGLAPLVVPYEDNPPEARILNAISMGALFEGRSEVADDLGITKAEFNRVLRSLKTSGAIYAGPGGRYRLSFSTANFPNIAAR
jgi:DNA-binding IclR family transcriptional regulator